jgi:galactose mutarotase-like enzyme
VEYLWQGDPAFWAGRNPTLFPMVGSTWDKILHIGGKEYRTGNHGFTRNSEFTCIEHTDTRIVMELKDNEETLSQYPFHFRLCNIYEIRGDTLTVTNELTNTGDTGMPFNFGYHPAFNVPMKEGESFDDYKILFDQPEIVNGAETKEMILDKEALAATVILTNPKSSTYTLTNGKTFVKITAPGFPWCAFWSPHAPFVCIEPWHSHTDFTKVEKPFEEREGTLILKPQETFTTGYSITVG